MYKVLSFWIMNEFHPAWTVWSIVANVVHVELFIEASKTPPLIYLEATSQSGFGKYVILDIWTPIPKSTPI